jgi:hypothetical protein
MKTSTFKSAIMAFTLILITDQVNAQGLACTRIEVNGSRYSDQVWVFAVSTCTRGFDNGWDGYKMLGTSTLIPQIFAIETCGKFQIDAVPTFTDTYIGFKAGEDSVYTLTFTNQLIEKASSELYLIDFIANKIVDIFKTGTSYTFKVLSTDTLVARFKISFNPRSDVTTEMGNTEKKQFKVYASNQSLIVDNPENQGGDIILYNISGKMVYKQSFHAAGITTLSTNLTTGIYIAKALISGHVNTISRFIFN